MGAIQESINSMLATTAAAAVALDKSPQMTGLKKDTKVKTELNKQEQAEVDAKELQEAQKNVDTMALRSLLADKEVDNPSESNPYKSAPNIIRKAQAVSAENNLRGAKTAMKNVQGLLNMRSALMSNEFASIDKLSNHGGIIGNLLANRKATNFRTKEFTPEQKKKLYGGIK